MLYMQTYTHAHIVSIFVEVRELGDVLPSKPHLNTFSCFYTLIPSFLSTLIETCKVNFPDHDNLKSFVVTITPGTVCSLHT